MAHTLLQPQQALDPIIHPRRYARRCGCFRHTAGQPDPRKWGFYIPHDVLFQDRQIMAKPTTCGMNTFHYPRCYRLTRFCRIGIHFGIDIFILEG